MTIAATATGIAFGDPALDNPAWSSLAGRHAHLAIGGDLVRRYPADVSPFVGVRTWDDPLVWDALTELIGPGAEVNISGSAPTLPAGWHVVRRVSGVQLVRTDRLAPRPDDEAVVLGPADVPDMLALVRRTEPGPFRPRTHELGRYVGIRREGQLVAMAGERLHPDGWTEISAVATDERYRRRGFASRLVLDVAHHIHERGDRAMLHTGAANEAAISAYQKLGFALRRSTDFLGVRIPE